ncbi:DUF2935 domain-containing protein [Clostridium bovifaecis]|uniref:DUF2935 domain-containing protein n=1 Tax=Clostridium bovifaecis TaxID=2184719 RepID=A0A6I6FDF5_9CLOT|nr:DUF2935 domain-containing protein [Clostridium bovifaecis]
MKSLLPENAVLVEHRFWLQILGDHSRFIFDALSPQEKEKIEKAQQFIVLFDDLLKEARKNLSNESIMMLTERSLKAAQEIRVFKLQIIKEHLVEKIKIALPPTFINHMVNEVEEYLRILGFIMQEQLPSPNPIYHHLLWLPDGAGHAGAIHDNLDKVEKPLKEISNGFAETFDSMHIKAIELCGYMRTGLTDFPALNKLNSDAEKEMTLFKGFLKELESLVTNKHVLGTIAPLLLDHMYREECYYLTKLSQVSEVKSPQCDPAKPRIT